MGSPETPSLLGDPKGREERSETRALLERLSHGDREALELLLQRDLDWIRDHVRRRLGARLRSRLESADVVQEAMVEFLRTGPAFLVSEQQEFRRIVARVVRNVIGHQHERLTAQRREAARDQPLPSGDVIDLDARRTANTSPSAAAQRNERAACVRLALELLEPTDREVLLLREWEQLPFACVASRLGVAEDAARMRFSRAVRRLARATHQIFHGRMEDLLDE